MALSGVGGTIYHISTISVQADRLGGPDCCTKLTPGLCHPSVKHEETCTLQGAVEHHPVCLQCGRTSIRVNTISKQSG